jgi:hypothetical protein
MHRMDHNRFIPLILLTRSSPPGAPFHRVGQLPAVGTGAATLNQRRHAEGAQGGVRSFFLVEE